jgi:hypothetical protein
LVNRPGLGSPVQRCLQSPIERLEGVAFVVSGINRQSCTWETYVVDVVTPSELKVGADVLGQMALRIAEKFGPFEGIS